MKSSEDMLYSTNPTAVKRINYLKKLLWRAAMVDVFAPILTALALFVVFRFRVSSAWLVLGGAAVGAAYKLLLG